MQPTWTVSNPYLLNSLLAILAPVALIALGIWLGLRLVRAPAAPTGTGAQARDRTVRWLVAAAALAIGLVWLFFSLTFGAPPGQSPLPLVLVSLFFLLIY